MQGENGPPVLPVEPTRQSRDFYETNHDSETVVYTGTWLEIEAKRAQHQLRRFQIDLTLPTLILHGTDSAPWIVRHSKRTHRYVTRVGNVDLFPAGITYDFAFDGRPQESFYLMLAPDFVRRVADEGGYPAAQVEFTWHNDLSDPLLLHLVQAVDAELKTGGQGGRLLGEALATALTVHLLTRYAILPTHFPDGIGGLSRSDLRRVQEFIQDQLHVSFSVAEMAACVHLSPTHFSRLFRQSTGQSPHQYVLKQRVEAARRLLLRGEIPLAEIAIQVGFANQSHFNRHFRKAFGIAPGAFLASSAPRFSASGSGSAVFALNASAPNASALERGRNGQNESRNGKDGSPLLEAY